MNSDHLTNHPPIYSPANDWSALLFASIPCVSEPFRPVFTLLYLLSEFTARDFSKLSLPPRSHSTKELFDTVFPDRDTLLRSLSFYGAAFHTPLLNTLANLLQAFQFYSTYKDLFSGLFSGFSAAPSSGPDESASPLSALFSGPDGLSPEFLNALSLINMPAGNSASATAPEHTSTSPSNKSASPPDKADAPSNEAATSLQEDFPAKEVPQNNHDVFDELFQMLTPEQQAIYDKLMQTDQNLQ